MASRIPNPMNNWLDGNAASQPDLAELEWPMTTSGVHNRLSNLSNTGVFMVCKSLPSTAFIGPDQHTRMYRIKHRKHRPLLPRLLLHVGPSDSSPIWAIYEAVNFYKAWAEIPCRSTESTLHGRVEVRRKRDGRRNKYVFTMRISGQKETFGWRRSKNTMIKDIGLSQNGYKLVRLTPGTHSSSSLAGPRTSDRMQVVALAARSHHVFPRRMALRYLASFGDEWEVISLLTVLAFWLWDRKRMVKG